MHDVGVLNRHESLAANLGAKLVGPLLLKSFEKLFDGPINIVQSSYTIQNSPVTWLDIVAYARTNPGDFVISEQCPGVRSCRFRIKGGQVEISEDDFRLVTSGAPERMIPTTPIADDESAELSTLNILEVRLGMLIKKADAVASKARQLNYHLKGRKTTITARKAAEQSTGVDPDAQTSSSQPFPAINSRTSQPPNNEATRLQAQLLEHYIALDRRTSLPQLRPKGSINGQESEARRLSQPPTALSDQYRAIMTNKIEKLEGGDTINPPCDRCRRLGYDCKKNLTACQACTKKHARCSWRDVKEGELDLSQLTVMGPQRQSTTPQRRNSPENGQSFSNSPLFVPQVANTREHGPQHPLSVTADAHTEDDSKTSQEQALLAKIATAASAAGNQ